MRTTLTTIASLALIAALSGCEVDNPYYSGTPPEISSIGPDFEYSLTGCQHVVIEVDDIEQCATPSVVFGSRNAVVLPSDKVESDQDVSWWADKCFTDIDIVDGAINVISPPGPVAGGEVDVQVACADGIALVDGGYRYADGRHAPDGTDLHEDEVSGFALFWQDGPFINVPYVYGYGFVYAQAVPRQSIYLSGDHDAVATREGIIPQIPPAEFELPEGPDRLRIGDSIDFYHVRDNAEDPIASYVGTADPMNFNEENALFLGVYYERPEGEACYAGAEMDGGGYYWGSGDSSESAAKGCVRFYRVHPNLKQGQDAAGNDLAPNELPLDFGWDAIGLGEGPDYETRTQEEGIELPSGTYYAYLTRGWRSFGYPFNPYDNLDVPMEYFPALEIEQGTDVVELPEEAVFSVPFDTSVRYYFESDTGGENVLPQEGETFVRAEGGTSYGVQVSGFDTDANGNGIYDDGEYVITVPPADEGFYEPLGLLGADAAIPYYIDRSQYEGIEMNSEDWDDFAGGSDSACSGILITWSPSGGDHSEYDFVTASMEVWEFGIGFSMGYTTVYRLVAHAWDAEGHICFPPQALAALPDISDTFGMDDDDGGYLHETYANSTFGSFNINKHRINKIPLDELRGNMVVDTVHLFGSYFFTVSDCEDGIDNDGDGLVDAADPGCGEDSLDHWELGGECDDNVDNDGDGLVDWADDGSGDPDCDALDDPSEGDLAACNDGWDNDGDGWIDYVADDPETTNVDESLWGDPGCEDADDSDEENDDLGECADGIDNDGDGLVDGYDPECYDADGSGYLQLSEAPECGDGIDNDGDGLIDYPEDPECEDAEDNMEAPTGCEDGLDNDGDGWIDEADPDCYYWGFSDESGTAVGAWACADGTDNDGDALIDGNDPGCIDAEDDSEEDPDPSCMDGLDNDGDGWTDNDDPDCQVEDGAEDPGGLGTTECNDGIDNDADGDIDADDADCEDANDDEEAGPNCNDGMDNDGDGWIDAEDPDCYYWMFDEENGTNVGAWACADGSDNDGDTLIDGNDPGCADAEDTDEAGPASCEDGSDNDGDGWTDYDDPSCDAGGAEDPGGLGTTECNDGLDNDGDGDIDADDADCVDAYDDDEQGVTTECADGADNDLDGWIDMDDPGCSGALDDNESNVGTTECNDGQDNDSDLAIDADDPDCVDGYDDDESA